MAKIPTKILVVSMAHRQHSFLSLGGAEAETLRLVFNVTTSQQWVEWLRVPLEHAAATGNHDLFTKLMKAGARCDAGWEGCFGRTLLHAAAQGGDADVLATVLRGGCRSDISVLSDYPGIPRRSPLYAAIEAGHEAAARQLVLAGADVNYSDPQDGCVPLVKAIEGGQGDLTRDLLIAGASLDDWKDPEHGRSRLHVAAEKGYDKVVSALVCTSLNVDARDNESKTPLMLASQNGHVVTAKALLIAGADVTLQAEDYRSSLHFAVEKGHTNVLKTILKFGISVPHSSRDVGSGWEDEEGIWEYTLYSAVCCDQVDCVETLLDAGVNIDFVFRDHEEHEGCTPLLIAIATNSTKAMLVLLQRGALVHEVDFYSNSGLHLACKSQKKGFDTTVDLLLRRGLSEADENDDCETAADVLEASVGEGQCSEPELERVRLLLKRAPQDRAWRRRCCLIILRSRIDKTRQLGSEADADKEDEGSDNRSLFDAEGSKSSGKTIVYPNHDARGSRSDEANEIHSNGASVVTAVATFVEGVGRGGWSGCVAFVVDQAPDPVFCAVVLFL